MSIVTMTSTVGPLTSGQTYRVRAKQAEAIVKATQGTKSNNKKLTGASPHLNEGK